VKKMGVYLKQIENTLGARQLGWEKFSQPGFPTLTIATGVIWIALVVASTGAAKVAIEQVKQAENAKVVCKTPK